MSGSTISSSDTRIEALSLQSSAYGVPLQVLYGVNRVKGNLIWYGGFKATPVTSTKSAGGKGGGVKTQNTTYNYTASVMMGLCEGQILGVPRAWKGKQLYSGGSLSTSIATATETYAVPGSGAMTYTVAHSAAWLSVVSVTVPYSYTSSGVGGDNVINTSQPLASGTDYTAGGGVLTILNAALRGLTVTITYQWASTALNQSALQQLGLTFGAGAVGQAVWSPLATIAPSQALGYSGLGYVAGQDYQLGTSAQVDNHSFEVQGPHSYSISSSTPDANPALATYDLITNGRFGAAFPSSQLAGLNDWSTYCLAAGLLMSPLLETQVQAGDFVTQMAQLTNTAPVWSNGRLKMIPYGDTTLTANGVTFTPNVTPVWDLTDDDFAPSTGAEPIKVIRKAQSDSYNTVRIEFLNRGNLYNIEIAEAKDSANIDVYGPRVMETIEAHWICDPAVARAVAQLILQRVLYVRNTYQFSLGWPKIFLEPMDLVTLTDSALGLNKLPVRITSVEESEAGDLAFEAEDFPLGTAHAAIYQSQIGAGFQHDYNVAPGGVSAPVVFEAPPSLTVTGLEVYIAAAGSSATWGGAHVWTSLDGTNYKQVGTINGPSRYGTLSTVVGATMGVQGMTGTLGSGSAADSAAYTTLCYVGGANPEYLAYQNATLTSAGAYTLDGLTRAGNGTSSAVHAVNDPFVRVDSGVVKSGPLDLSMIGKTLHIKLTSFNLYGGGEEALSGVTDYTYTISGAIVKLPPIAPSSFSSIAEQFGIRLFCNKSVDPDVIGYEYRQGASWAAGTILATATGTSYLWQVQAVGSFTFWVAAIDVFGNYSTPISTTVGVAAGTVTGFAQSIQGTDLVLSWTSVAGAFATQTTEIRVGASWATATVLGQFASAYQETVHWGGSRVYWASAIDVRGNYGVPVSTTVSLAAPGAVSGQRVDVVDNDALIYWNAPSTGSLPVDHYEVRKGASWAAGIVIGSNGNSNFAGVFEQLAGTYTYWIAAWDTGGNIGTPASVTATINQPPDYVLRANIYSVFAGTLSNMYIEGGSIVGPVDLTKTWATHFSSNSWASPADQISAGMPIYAEPSVASGTYTETFDYGTVLAATTVVVTVNQRVIAGTESISCQIYTSPDNTTYTAQAAGFSALCSNFRWVRYVLTVTGTPGANLNAIDGINIKLSIKQRTDSGQGTSVIGGVTVNFGYPFIAADTPVVQANGLDTFSKPYFCAVIFAGTPNPTTFAVRIFNSAGTEVAGVNFSWTARGY